MDLCGDWGSRTKIEDFRYMLDNVEYKEYIDKIYAELDHQVFTPNADLETFKRELARLWFKKRGFTHIMCGEPKKRKLGECIFLDVIYKLRKIIGLVDIIILKMRLVIEFTQLVLYLKILITGLLLKVKGYDLSHSDDLIIYATKAYKGLSQSINLTTNKFCLYNHDGITYVLVASKDAIVTFFADLTPNCKAGKEQCNCIRNVVS